MMLCRQCGVSIARPRRKFCSTRCKDRSYAPSTPRTQRCRDDPEKRERDREASRRWKREHLGQPGLPAADRGKTGA